MTWDEFWKHEYGKVIEAKDFAGRLVRKGDFQELFLREVNCPLPLGIVII